MTCQATIDQWELIQAKKEAVSWNSILRVISGVLAATGAILLYKFKKKIDEMSAPPQPHKAPDTTP